MDAPAYLGRVQVGVCSSQQSPPPVSYTHLDVYKRQGYWCVKGHSLRYFGSWFNPDVENDFTDAELRDFTLRKEIIFESKDIAEINKKESELIRLLKSNDPAIGYIDLGNGLIKSI